MTTPRHRAVLVGASGGIGSAIARSLAPRCDSLLLVGRDRARLDSLARELATACAVVPLAADIATHAGRRAVADAAGAQQSDLLVNCAGTSEFTWFAEQSEEAIERIVDDEPRRADARRACAAARPREGAAGGDRQRGLDLRLPRLPGLRHLQRKQVWLARLHEALRRELAGSRIRVDASRAALDAHALNSDAMYALNRRARRGRRRSAGRRGRVARTPRLAASRAPARDSRSGCSRASTSCCRALVDKGMRRQLPHIQRELRGRPVPGAPAEVISIEGCDQCGANP